MIRTIDQRVECKKCGTYLQMQTMDCLNVTLNPELRNMVLEENLFLIHCSKCGNDMKVLYPCIYHDMINKFIICLIPKSIKERLNTDLLQIPPEFKNFKKRIVYDIATFKEEILIFENNLFDEVVLAIKSELLNLIKSKLKSDLVRGYFYGTEVKSKDLKFVFFFNGQVCYKNVKYKFYEEAYTLSCKNQNSNDSFVKIK